MYPIFHIFHPIQDQEDLTKIRRNNLRIIIDRPFLTLFSLQISLYLSIKLSQKIRLQKHNNTSIYIRSFIFKKF